MYGYEIMMRKNFGRTIMGLLAIASLQWWTSVFFSFYRAAVFTSLQNPLISVAVVPLLSDHRQVKFHFRSGHLTSLGEVVG